MSNFNENSSDAMFAKILQRLDTQDATLLRIEQGVTKTNGRVTALEHDKWYQRGIVAAVTIGVATGFEWVKSKW